MSFLISNFCHVLYVVRFLLDNSPASEDGTDSVPKRWHIKFRRQGITQEKTYNINVMFKTFFTGQHYCKKY